MTQCPVCHTDSPNTASLCMNCGTNLIGARATHTLARAEASIMHGDLAAAQADMQQATAAIAELEGGQANHALIIARAGWVQGTIYYIKGQAAQAAVEIKAAIALLEGDEAGKPLLAEALNTMGNLDYMRGEMKAAHDYYQHGVRLAEQTRNHQLSVKLWTNLGNISVSEGRVYEALFHYNKATQFAELDNNAAALAMCYRMLCYIYVVIGPLARAMEYANRIVELLPKIENQGQRCNALIAVGVVNRYYGNLEQASSYLLAALEIAERSANEVVRADALAKLGQVYLDGGDYERGYAIAGRLFGDQDAPPVLQKEAAAQLLQFHVSRCDFAAAREYVNWIRNFEQQAQNEPERLYLPLAIYFAALGDWEQAVQSFELAIEQSKQRGDAYELGRDYFEYARAASRRDGVSHEQLMPLLEQAAAIFRKVGAARNLAMVLEMLQECDATPHLGNRGAEETPQQRDSTPTLGNPN